MRERALRARFLDGGLFGEPGWAILLDLFVAASEGREVPVISTCIASGSPQTTALRWIALLERRGLVMRRPDPSDSRSALLTLTPAADTAVADYFTCIGNIEDAL